MTDRHTDLINSILDRIGFAQLIDAEIAHFVDGYRSTVKAADHPAHVVDAVAKCVSDALPKHVARLRQSLIAVYRSVLTEEGAANLLSLYDDPRWRLHEHVLQQVSPGATQAIVEWLNTTFNAVSPQLAAIFEAARTPGAPPAVLPQPA